MSVFPCLSLIAPLFLVSFYASVSESILPLLSVGLYPPHLFSQLPACLCLSEEVSVQDLEYQTKPGLYPEGSSQPQEAETKFKQGTGITVLHFRKSPETTVG